MPLSGFKSRPEDPILGMLWDLRRDVHHLALATVGLFLSLVVAAVIIVAVRTHDVNARIDDNRAAVAYICSTTHTVDDLVVEAISSFETNIESGLYERLEAEGTIPEGSTEKAVRSLVKYRKAHVVLQNREPCEQVQ